MRTHLALGFAFATLLIAALGCGGTPSPRMATKAAVASVGPGGTFGPLLAPYGRWAPQGDLGWVWRPARRTVGAKFVPYLTGGRWRPTVHGWAFVGRQPWSWIVFHYGRWDFDPAGGWYWVPGADWAPAWVAWRSVLEGTELIGWAPLPPRRQHDQKAQARWVFSTGEDFASGKGFATGIERLLPREQALRALKASKQLLERRKVGSLRWYPGPRRPADAAAFDHPGPGRLARLRVKGKRLTLERLQKTKLPAPPRPAARPARTSGSPFAIPPSAVLGPVIPAMPLDTSRAR